MENTESRINSLKTRLEAKKNEKTRAEANLEMAQKQLDDVTAKIREMGYEPDDLPEVIKQMEMSIAENLAEAERILNQTESGPVMKEAAVL